MAINTCPTIYFRTAVFICTIFRASLVWRRQFCNTWLEKC